MKIVLQNISKSYSSSNQRDALNGVSLVFDGVGLTFVVGKSGSGKTTLMNIVGGLDTPTSGELYYGEDDTAGYKERTWDYYRNLKTGIVFQEYNLHEDLTVEENLLLALDVRAGLTTEEKQRRIEECLQECGVLELKSRRVTMLSGGEKQRVAIARALVKRPFVILADEPTGNLDVRNGQMIFEELERISKQCMVIVVSHDIDAARIYADRIIELSDGQVIRDEANQQKNARWVFSVKNEQGEVLWHSDSLEDPVSKLTACCDAFGKVGELYAVREEKMATLPEDKVVPEEEEGRPKGLSVGKTIRLAKAHLKKRKVRLCISIVILALATFLFTSFCSLLNNDYEASLVQYYTDNPEPIVMLEMSEDYVGERSNAGQGSYVRERLTELVGEKSIFPYKAMNQVSQEPTNEVQTTPVDGSESEKERAPIATIGTFLLEDGVVPNVDYTGKMPEACGELAVTDYVLEQLGMDEESIGAELYWNNEKCTITAIVHTDYREMGQYAGAGDANWEYYMNYRYSVAYLSEQTVDMLRSNAKEEYKSLLIHSGNILLSNMSQVYATSSSTYCTVEAVTEDQLLYGTLPDGDGEILLTEYLASNKGIIAEGKEFQPTTIKIRDLYEGQSQEWLLACTNMRDFLGESVTVTGIVDEDADFYVSQNVYEKLVDLYYNYFYYQKLGVEMSRDMEDKVSGLYASAFILATPDCQHVYEIHESMRRLSIYGTVITAALLIIMVGTIVSSVYYSEKDNRRKIGVLRALGVERRNVAGIFTVETVVLSLGAILLATGGTLWFYQFVHTHLEKKMVWRHYVNVLNPNYGVLALVTGGVLLACLAIAIVPIILVTRKKPVEIIRG